MSSSVVALLAGSTKRQRRTKSTISGDHLDGSLSCGPSTFERINCVFVVVVFCTHVSSGEAERSSSAIHLLQFVPFGAPPGRISLGHFNHNNAKSPHINWLLVRIA